MSNFILVTTTMLFLLLLLCFCDAQQLQAATHAHAANVASATNAGSVASATDASGTRADVIANDDTASATDAAAASGGNSATTAATSGANSATDAAASGGNNATDTAASTTDAAARVASGGNSDSTCETDVDVDANAPVNPNTVTSDCNTFADPGISATVTLGDAAGVNACTTLSKSNAQVERNVYNAGLHRMVETLVWLSSTVLPLELCSVLLQEQLPSGAYFDPDELNGLTTLGSVPPSVLSERVDVEAGEWASSGSTALFYPLHLLQQTPDNTWLVNYTVPLHARYHRARSSAKHGSEALVRITHPMVFVLCPSLPKSCLPYTLPRPCAPSDAGHDYKHQHGVHEEAVNRNAVLGKSTAPGGDVKTPQVARTREESSFGFNPPTPQPYPDRFSELPTCYWLPIHSFSTSECITLSVPVGNTDQLDTVLFVTTAVTTAATLLLLTPLLKQYQQQMLHTSNNN